MVMTMNETRSGNHFLPSSELSPALHSLLSAVWGTERGEAMLPILPSSPSTSPRPGIKMELGFKTYATTTWARQEEELKLSFMKSF